MVVDDEPDQIFAIKVNLEELSDKYEIISANSGMQCLHLLKNNQIPDLILLDIMMPGMSGWETFNRIKASELWKNIPIIFLTARTDRVAEDAGSFFGDDYIEKPYDLEDLKERIEKVLKNSALHIK
jgi:CheY-like chemotaxis protein